MKRTWGWIAGLLVCASVVGGVLWKERSTTAATQVVPPLPPQARQIQQLEGYGLVVVDQTDAPVGEYVLAYEEQAETFAHRVKLINNNGVDTRFSLSVYLDYQQLPFQVAGQEGMHTTYEFDLRNGESITLPVQFALKHLAVGSHDLLFTAVAGAHKHASSMTQSSEVYGTTGRYQLVRGTDEQARTSAYVPPQDLPWQTFTAPPEQAFRGIRINTNQRDIEANEVPPLRVTAKPGERLQWALRAGGDASTQDYLALLTIGYQQVSLGEGQPYWYFQSTAGKLAYRALTITAPEQPGQYEVCAYLAANPFTQLDDGFMRNVEQSSSYRFTLHVEG